MATKISDQLLKTKNWSEFLQASSYKTPTLDSFVNRRWKEIFGRSRTIKKLLFKSQSSRARDPLDSRPGKGLVYFYLIDGRVRYIGQTQARSLHRRLMRWRPKIKVGYNFAVKRCLLAAYYGQRLQIRTLPCPVYDLSRLEEYYIRRYGPTNYLWNQRHNEQHFDPQNYRLDCPSSIR